MKLLLLLLIFVFGFHTGFTQTVQKQASQVITLQLMPVTVIELPASSGFHKKRHTTDTSAVQPARGKWIIQKQLLAFTYKPQAAPVSAGNKLNRQPPGTLNDARTTYPVVYTLTTL